MYDGDDDDNDDNDDDNDDNDDDNDDDDNDDNDDSDNVAILRYTKESENSITRDSTRELNDTIWRVTEQGGESPPTLRVPPGDIK